MNTTHRVTLQEMVLYCIKNRTPMVFTNWTEGQIANTIYECIKEGTMSYSVNEKTGQINGIVLAYRLETDPNNVLVINDILTTERGVVRKFIQFFRDRFPNMSIEGTDSKKRWKKYNTPRFAHLIEEAV